MLQRVANHQYLFRRGSRFYFRRVVPEDARQAFGGKAHETISLKTDSLPQARHALARCLRDFDRTVAEARAAPDPTLPNLAVTRRLRVPDNEEIDAVVRAWLKTQEAQIVSKVLALSPDQLDASAQELGQFERMVRATARQRREDNFLLGWISDHLAQVHGWDCAASTPQRAYLEVRLARGQLEWARIVKSEYALEPRPRPDAYFAPEYDVRDAAILIKAKEEAPVPIFDLVEGWAREHAPEPATLKAWKTCLRSLVDYLGHDDALKVTRADVIGWKDALLAPQEGAPSRSQRTVKDKYLASAKTVFGWAEKNLRIPENPAAKVVVTVPKKQSLREDVGLSDAEARIILSASLKAHDDTGPSLRAFARRWVPWLTCGARRGRSELPRCHVASRGALSPPNDLHSRDVDHGRRGQGPNGP